MPFLQSGIPECAKDPRTVLPPNKEFHRATTALAMLMVGVSASNGKTGEPFAFPTQHSLFLALSAEAGQPVQGNHSPGDAGTPPSNLEPCQMQLHI